MKTITTFIATLLLILSIGCTDQYGVDQTPVCYDFYKTAIVKTYVVALHFNPYLIKQDSIRITTPFTSMCDLTNLDIQYSIPEFVKSKSYYALNKDKGSTQLFDTLRLTIKNEYNGKDQLVTLLWCQTYTVTDTIVSYQLR